MSKLGRAFGTIGSYMSGPKPKGRLGAPATGKYKIYRTNVDKISVSKFKKVRMRNEDGEIKEYTPVKLKKKLKEIVPSGGVSKYLLEKELIKKGLDKSQVRTRKELIRILSGEGAVTVSDKINAEIKEKLSTRRILSERLRAEDAAYKDRKEVAQQKIASIGSSQRNETAQTSGQISARINPAPSQPLSPSSVSVQKVKPSDSVVPAGGTKKVTVYKPADINPIVSSPADSASDSVNDNIKKAT